MNLMTILLEKARENKLGHFYIVETSASEESSHEELYSFVHQLIRNYYQKVEGTKHPLSHLMDHPDVLVLGNFEKAQDEKAEKSFKVEDAEALARFFEFKPVQGKKKFAVITEAHRINPTVANKWLKLFEEPQGNSTIFLLNPRRVQLLPTIHSRAIHLRLSGKSRPSDFSEWNDFLDQLNKMPLSEFIDHYKQENLGFWVNELIRWESEFHSDPASKDKLGSWLKTFTELETFHQPSATKWALFHSFIKQSVLPRWNR